MKIRTVTGWITPQQAGITDAHNHAWIEPVPGTTPGLPVLVDQENISKELMDFHQAGGGTIIDCQPGGCGRNGRVLYQLSKESKVHLISCTGFHLKKYYQPDYWLFDAPVEKAADFFLSELCIGLVETLDTGSPVQAGFIKIACQESLIGSPMNLMEAAVMASMETNSAIEVHTEKGLQGEQIARALLDFGLSPSKLILCHVDKRPDYGFHYELFTAGVTLEYDTFFRSKYHPDEHVWPLLERVVSAGFEGQVVVATDLADSTQWSRLGNGPGLTGLMDLIMPRMAKIGFQTQTIQKLIGGNIASRLVRSTEMAEITNA